MHQPHREAFLIALPLGLPLSLLPYPCSLPYNLCVALLPVTTCSYSNDVSVTSRFFGKYLTHHQQAYRETNLLSDHQKFRPSFIIHSFIILNCEKLLALCQSRIITLHVQYSLSIYYMPSKVVSPLSKDQLGSFKTVPHTRAHCLLTCMGNQNPFLPDRELHVSCGSLSMGPGSW